MVRRASFAFFIFAVSQASYALAKVDADDVIKSPSSVSVMGGTDSLKSQTSSINGVLSLGLGPQIFVSYDSTKEDYDLEEIVSRTGQFGIGTDPLNTFSAVIMGLSSRSNDELASRGVTATLSYSWNLLSASIIFGQIRSYLTSRDTLFTDPETFEINQRQYGLSLDISLTEQWNASLRGTSYSYDRDLSPLANEIVLAFLPTSVQSSVPSFLTWEVGFGGSYQVDDWLFGLDFAFTRAETDGVENLSSTFRTSYAVTSAWSADLSVGSFKSTNAGGDPLQFGEIGATYSWQ